MWGDSDPEWPAGDDAAGFTPRATVPTYPSTSAATGEFFLTSRLHGRVRIQLADDRKGIKSALCVHPFYGGCRRKALGPGAGLSASRRSLVSAHRRCSRRGLTKSTIAQNERMTSQCPDQKRKANETGQEPMHEGWQRSPQREVRSIVDIERWEKQDVGDRHARDVESEVDGAEMASCGACGRTRGQR